MDTREARVRREGPQTSTELLRDFRTRPGRGRTACAVQVRVPARAPIPLRRQLWDPRSGCPTVPCRWQAQVRGKHEG